jgi:hypothetical protein
LRRVYALLAGAVFLIEVAIAHWWDDAFVRPYLGDVLAVILVYLALRAATGLDRIGAAGLALVIAVLIELAQLVHLLDAVGLGGSRVARVMLGGVFDPRDIVCYLAGAMVAVALDRPWLRRSSALDPG